MHLKLRIACLYAVFVFSTTSIICFFFLTKRKYIKRNRQRTINKRFFFELRTLIANFQFILRISTGNTKSSFDFSKKLLYCV